MEKIQTGTGLLGTLYLALTGLFQEIQIQYLLQQAVTHKIEYL